MSPSLLLLRALSLAFSSLALVGCAERERFPAATLPEDLPVSPGPRFGNVPCDEGDTLTCVGVYGQHEGFTNCYWGERTCVAGAWSACKPLPDPA